VELLLPAAAETKTTSHLQAQFFDFE